MLALALPLLLVSALLGALRGRVTPVREPKPNGGTMNKSVTVPAAPQRAPAVTTGHSGHSGSTGKAAGGAASSDRRCGRSGM